MKNVLLILVGLVSVNAAQAELNDAVHCVGVKKGNVYGVRVKIENSQGTQLTFFGGDTSYNKPVWFQSKADQEEAYTACNNLISISSCTAVEKRNWDKTFHDGEKFPIERTSSAGAIHFAYSDAEQGKYFVEFDGCVERRADIAVEHMEKMLAEANAKQTEAYRNSTEYKNRVRERSVY